MSFPNITITANSTANSSQSTIIKTTISTINILFCVGSLGLYLFLGWAIDRDSPEFQRLPRWASVPISRILAVPWWVLSLPYYRIYLDYIWWPAAQVKIYVVFVVEVLGVFCGALRAMVAGHWEGWSW